MFAKGVLFSDAYSNVEYRVKNWSMIGHGSFRDEGFNCMKNKQHLNDMFVKDYILYLRHWKEYRLMI